MLCKNTCDNPFGNGGRNFIRNRHCQDGHADAEGAQCDLGTDCDDTRDGVCSTQRQRWKPFFLRLP